MNKSLQIIIIFVGSLGMAAAVCNSGTDEATPAERIVTRVVEVTREVAQSVTQEVEVTQPAAPDEVTRIVEVTQPSQQEATQAIGATQEVQQEATQAVEVTQEVQQEQEATPTDVASPTPTSTQSPSPTEQDAGAPGSGSPTPDSNEQSQLASATGGLSTTPCYLDIDTPYVLINIWAGRSAFSEASPYNQVTPDDGVTGMDYRIWGCNLEPNSRILLTYYPPGGRAIAGSTSFIEESEPIDIWTSIPGEPLGTYTVVIDTDQGRAELNFTVNAAHAPLLRGFCDDFPIPDLRGQLLLTGFMPGETVTLSRYPNSDVLSPEETWTVLVGDNGASFTSPPNMEGIFIAQGAERPLTIDLGGTDHAVSGWDRPCPSPY